MYLSSIIERNKEPVTFVSVVFGFIFWCIAKAYDIDMFGPCNRVVVGFPRVALIGGCAFLVWAIAMATNSKTPLAKSFVAALVTLITCFVAPHDVVSPLSSVFGTISCPITQFNLFNFGKMGLLCVFSLFLITIPIDVCLYIYRTLEGLDD